MPTLAPCHSFTQLGIKVLAGRDELTYIWEGAECINGISVDTVYTG